MKSSDNEKLFQVCPKTILIFHLLLQQTNSRASSLATASNSGPCVHQLHRHHRASPKPSSCRPPTIPAIRRHTSTPWQTPITIQTCWTFHTGEADAIRDESCPRLSRPQPHSPAWSWANLLIRQPLLFRQHRRLSSRIRWVRSLVRQQVGYGTL